jgi:hypothetical protein
MKKGTKSRKMAVKKTMKRRIRRGGGEEEDDEDLKISKTDDVMAFVGRPSDFTKADWNLAREFRQLRYDAHGEEENEGPANDAYNAFLEANEGKMDMFEKVDEFIDKYADKSEDY